MKPCFCLVLASALLLLSQLIQAGEQPGKPLVSGLKNPTSVAGGPGGKVYVALAGDGKSDGAIVVIENDKAVPFATGLDEPRGLVAPRNQKWLYVAEKQRIMRIDMKGKADVLVAADAFPQPPINLHDLTIDYENGVLYVTDQGDQSNKGGAIYRIAPPNAGKKGFAKQGADAKDSPPPKSTVTLVGDQARWPMLQRPGGLVLDGQNHLLVADAGRGTLYRIHLASKEIENVADGLGQCDGLAWDRFGRLYISDSKGGKVFVIGRPGAAPVVLSKSFQSATDLGLDWSGKHILVADRKAGTVSALPTTVPGAEVDERPLAVESVAAFPKIQWTDWKSETDTGKPVQLRPIVLTHAGDGSNRTFVATQHGVIHVFPNDPKVEKTKVFLDIQKKVTYSDFQNEEGFLGLAFHPQFKSNGQFFVFYTLKTGKKDHVNLLSRFRVSKDDPDRADPDSEEILLRFEHKNWNHDGGTICFGPDGYLYTTTGDGGSANDPDKNGQNLKSWLAKVIRIDVDHKDPGKNYAVPKDNPFVGRDDALPEVWAYGLRNIWRMAFDKKTGKLWAGDVGQNLHEEVDIIVKGGNYGWSLREGLHPFGAKGVSQRKDLIDPIWEYHHSLGVCVIGGCVYRGQDVPELDGAYLYADYTPGKIWALRYDDAAKRVTENRPLHTPGEPVLSFGEDERGEVYFMTNTSLPGRAIFRVQKQGGKAER
jgi:glucose/arabinose dehydrogenase